MAPAFAQERPLPLSPYQVLAEKARRIDETNTTEGWSYIVSGAVALGVSTPAYYMTEDTFGRAIYSLGQTLGIGAIGYGSYLVMMKNDYTLFHLIISSSKEISPRTRDEMAYRFLLSHAAKARSVRKIRTITHGLTAALNISSGLTSKNRELKTALYFVGGINLLAAANFAFRRSEEEKFLDQFNHRNGARKTSFHWEPVVGEIVGMRISF